MSTIKGEFIEFKQVPMMTMIGDGQEILRFEYNGDVYFKGRLIENDKEVVDGFRLFLEKQGIIIPKEDNDGSQESNGD